MREKVDVRMLQRGVCHKEECVTEGYVTKRGMSQKVPGKL